jgi:alginate O-acetyltransferase complex protein AlgI
MVFTSSVFLYLFLPLFLAVYYLLPGRNAGLARRGTGLASRGTGLAPRARLLWILAASWVFYGWWRLDFLALIAAATCWTYLAGLRIGLPRAPGREGRARTILVLGIVLNLAVLGYFKYFNFGIANLNALLSSLGARPLAAWEVVLPVGISFYLFHSISYLVDVYRGDAPVASDFLELAVYMALFPQLVAGPIIRYKDLSPQLRSRTHTLAGFSEGAARFMTGFCKKVLIADVVAPLANAGFALASPTAGDAWLAALAYTAQIYFDFSGYSDMAIGLGLMMGFRFPENFRSPYLSRSIPEFWRRWHISLSTWLRDYLYIPLGGNRLGPERTIVNLMLVMVLGGLWHGAAWTFLLWGAWHGLFLALQRRRKSRELDGSPAPASGVRAAEVAATMAVVMVGWVLFRSPSLGAALRVYAGMIGLHGLGLSAAMRWQFGGLELAALGFALVAVYAGPWLLRDRTRPAPRAAMEGSPAALAQAALAQAAPAPAATASAALTLAARAPAATAANAPQAAAAASPSAAAGWPAQGIWKLPWNPPLTGRLAVIALFVLALLRTAAESFSPFLYFKF